MSSTIILIGLLLIGFILSLTYKKPKYRNHPLYIALIALATLYFLYRIIDEGGGFGNIFAALIGIAVLIEKFTRPKKLSGEHISSGE